MGCNLFETTGWTRGPNFTAVHTVPSAVSITPPTDMIVTEGFRGLRIMIITTSAGDTNDFTLYGVERAHSRENQYMYLTRAFTSNNAVEGGATTGVAGGLVTADEFFCDVFPAITTTTYGTKILNYVNGTIDVFSESGGIGFYQISDVGNLYGILPTMDVEATLADYAAFIWQLDR